MFMRVQKISSLPGGTAFFSISSADHKDCAALTLPNSNYPPELSPRALGLKRLPSFGNL